MIEQFANGEMYHVVIRGVGDTEIFKDENDYFRAIFSIYELNNSNKVSVFRRRRDRMAEKRAKKRREKLYDLGGRTILGGEDLRNPFVHILAFCFMPNHIHLLVKQIKDGGVSKFMQKVGAGYAKYFNEKYRRKGHLFNRYKAVHIHSDNQLKIVCNYIHCNPISLIEPGWKERGVRDASRVMDFLVNEYRWSSLHDYLGKPNFASVTNRETPLAIIGGSDMVRQWVADWANYKSAMKEIDYRHYE